MIDVMIAICDALEFAHTRKILHRDIKPSNIFCQNKGPVKLIDFGVAKMEGETLTKSGTIVGSPHYMSPEQVKGEPVDRLTDIYSLGVLLYELLTGTTPFEIDRLQSAAYDELLRIIREEEPPRPSVRISTIGGTLERVANQHRVDPSKLKASLRGDLDWIVMRCLEKDRTRRYETANDLAADVLELVSALCVAGSFGWRGVTQAARDFDDDAGLLEQEVDSSDVSFALVVYCLRHWSR